MIVRLYHSSLITDLCKATKVVWALREEILQPKHVIDDHLVNTVKDWKDETSRAIGASS